MPVPICRQDLTSVVMRPLVGGAIALVNPTCLATFLVEEFAARHVEYVDHLLFPYRFTELQLRMTHHLRCKAHANQGRVALEALYVPVEATLSPLSGQRCRDPAPDWCVPRQDRSRNHRVCVGFSASGRNVSRHFLRRGQDSFTTGVPE